MTVQAFLTLQLGTKVVLVREVQRFIQGAEDLVRSSPGTILTLGSTAYFGIQRSAYDRENRLYLVTADDCALLP